MMLHSLILSLIIFVMGEFNPKDLISIVASSDPCNYVCMSSWLFPDMFETDFVDLSENERSREKILSIYREYLNELFGPDITENVFFGKKWREMEIGNANSLYPGLIDNYHEIGVAKLYYFSSHPDFLLISPMYMKETIGQLYDMAVYLPNTDSIYLNNIWNSDTAKNERNPDDFRQTFNYWIENSNDLKDMEPLCLAGLLLYFEYHYNEIYFINSPDELYIAFAIQWATAKPASMDLWDPPLPCKPALYFEDLEKFANDRPQLDSLIQDRIDAQNRLGTYDVYLDHAFHAPIVQSDSAGISITVTVLSDEELADWKIVFDSGNHLISMDYLSEPVLGHPWDTAYSPYYLDRK